MATFGIEIVSMNMFLAKLKFIKKKGGGYYVAPPSEEYTDPKTGEKKWANFWWFGDKSSGFFQSEVQKALKEYCNEKGLQRIYED